MLVDIIFHDIPAMQELIYISAKESLRPLCPQLTGRPRIVINCSGRGDKDVQTVAKYLGQTI